MQGEQYYRRNMRQDPFALEQLEGRTLLSGVASISTAPLAPAAAVLAAPRTTAVRHPFPAAFNVAGKFTHPFGNPDAGSQYDLRGSGKTAVLGKFTVAGHVQGPGLILNGRASGRLVLTNSHGTITLALHGPPQNPGSLPPSFSFYVFKGTGAYAHSTGKGQIAVSASETTHKFLFRFAPET
jgi:hypothetical protein